MSEKDVKRIDIFAEELKRIDIFRAYLSKYERAKMQYDAIRAIFGYPELADIEDKLLEELKAAKQQLEEFVERESGDE